MRETYYREQRHICGSSYMEVDLYQVTAPQHRASRRRKRREASTLAMQTYNDKKAKRYFVQLINSNFQTGDYVFTATYDDAHALAAGADAEADTRWGNFIKRLYRWCKRHKVERPAWVAITEYRTQQEDGDPLGRTHHHAIFRRTQGLTREALEELWRDERGAPMGMCRCERLQMEHGSAEALARYFTKNRRCVRRWRQSRGLQKPVTPPPNDSRWSRRKLEEASTLHVDDREFWARKYPGYTMSRVETNVSEAGCRHTLVILYREEKRQRRRRKNNGFQT